MIQQFNQFKFQLTTSRGGRLFDGTDEIPAYAFQLTTSRGGRHNSPAFKNRLPVEHFNSRPHEEVDDGCTAICIRHTTFQLTTSRGGRPLRHNPGPKFLSISTHDLTRRSTGRNRSRSRKEIFQLTTSQGGRLLIITAPYT